MVKETHIKGGYIFSLLMISFINEKYIYEYNIVYKIILIYIYIFIFHISDLYFQI